MKNKKINTEYICPSIPLRQWDWLACYDGEEEKQNYGWGKTENEAIDDLINNGDEE